MIRELFVGRDREIAELRLRPERHAERSRRAVHDRRRVGHREDPAVRGAGVGGDRARGAGRVGQRLGGRRRAAVLAVGAGRAGARRRTDERRAPAPARDPRRQRSVRRPARPGGPRRAAGHAAGARARVRAGPVRAVRRDRHVSARPRVRAAARARARRPPLGRRPVAAADRVPRARRSTPCR